MIEVYYREFIEHCGHHKSNQKGISRDSAPLDKGKNTH